MTLPERVWLLRHAETTAHSVFNGAESDVELSERGQAQAAAVSSWFASAAVRPSVVVSSGMTRAIQTAKPIAQSCGVKHHIESDLHERRIGALAGTSFQLSTGPWAETIQNWCEGNTAFTTPGAESFADLQARLLPAWQRVMECFPAGRVVIVAHGIVCKVLLLSLLPDYTIRDWTKIGRAENVSVSEMIPNETHWQAVSLLQVPEPVQSVMIRSGPATS